eukprot:5925649-Amphidinium_carterae.1
MGSAGYCCQRRAQRAARPEVPMLQRELEDGFCTFGTHLLDTLETSGNSKSVDKGWAFTSS